MHERISIKSRRRSHMQGEQSRLHNHVTSIPVKVEAFCGERTMAYEITCMHTLPVLATPVYCGEAAPAAVSQPRPDASQSAGGHPL
jgi:ribosomal protein L32